MHIAFTRPAARTSDALIAGAILWALMADAAWLALAGMVVLVLAAARLLAALRVARAPFWSIAIAGSTATLIDLSSAHWGDALHLGAGLMAVAMLGAQRPRAMMAWLGVAIALHPLALLMAPICIAMGIRRRAPLSAWLAAPAALLAMVAAQLIGNGALPSLPIFTAGLQGQTPSIWSIVALIAPAHLPSLFALAVALALGSLAWLIARLQIIPLTDTGLVGIAAQTVLLAALLLPGLPQQSFLLAAPLILAYALASGTRPSVATAAMVHLGLATAAFSIPFLSALAACCLIAASWALARPLLRPQVNDNPAPPEHWPRSAENWPRTAENWPRTGRVRFATPCTTVSPVI